MDRMDRHGPTTMEPIAMSSPPSQFELGDQRLNSGLSYDPTPPLMGPGDSQTRLSPSTPGLSQFYHSPAYDPLLMNHPEYSPSPTRASGCAFFPRRWSSSWNAYVFFAFGLACAIGHHVFYSALNGKPADDQLQMLRYGTVLAFGTKAGLCAAVVAAYRQRVWTTVRTRFLSIGALDSLFAATEDLRALWNWELVKDAKTAMALAVIVW